MRERGIVKDMGCTGKGARRTRAQRPGEGWRKREAAGVPPLTNAQGVPLNLHKYPALLDCKDLSESIKKTHQIHEGEGRQVLKILGGLSWLGRTHPTGNSSWAD
eukprot:1147913-Pelagomonas_calceolata.AAC.2